jgi:hypothetical protein
MFLSLLQLCFCVNVLFVFVSFPCLFSWLPVSSQEMSRVNATINRDKLVSRPLRLLGLGVSSLREPNGRQLVLL